MAASSPSVLPRPTGSAVNGNPESGPLATMTSSRTVDNRADRGTVVGQNPNGTALPGETILLQISTGEVPPPPAPPGDSGDNSDNSDNSDDGGDDGGDDN